MEIFSDHVIVDEKTISFISTIKISEYNDKVVVKDTTQFAAFEFALYGIKVINSVFQVKLSIRDVGNATAKSSEPLAQIILWGWAQGTQEMQRSIVLNKGQTIIEEKPIWPFSAVIRILKKRQLVENPCPPICSPGDDLTVHIGDRRLTVSAHWLMSVSPMVQRMLSVDMREKQQRELKLDGHGISMEQFSEFMDAISTNSFRHPFFPNPQNVLVFLWFADYFQIEWLKERCGVHLANCVEIPFAERFLLIERYKLTNLMHYFSRLLTES